MQRLHQLRGKFATLKLHHFTEAKRWFDDIPGKDDALWCYVLHRQQLKAILDADPMFQSILASAEKPKE